jgi:delta 1-pyrroline-5-carboxylate dehydrogenase
MGDKPANPRRTIGRVQRTRGPRTITSIVNGRPVAGAPAAARSIANPAQRTEVVSEARLADADTFVDACGAAKAAHRSWAEPPRPSAAGPYKRWDGSWRTTPKRSPG